MTTDNNPVENKTPVNKDENMWAMFCHLSALVGFVIPFGNIIAPLIIWTLKKDEYPHVNDTVMGRLVILNSHMDANGNFASSSDILKQSMLSIILGFHQFRNIIFPSGVS